MSALPVGWVNTTLGNVVTIRNGYAFKSTDFRKDGTPVVRQSNLTGELVDLTNCVYVSASIAEGARSFRVSRGDLLLGMSGSIGEPSVYSYDFDAVQNQRTGLVKFSIGDDGHRNFIKRALTLFEREYTAQGKGVGVQNVSAADIEKTQVPLPPLPEQRRIVAKISSVSANSRRARDRLDHIPRLVEKYKQAILAAGYTDAKRRSEQAATLGSISLEVRNGLSKKPSDDPSGFPILRISAVRSMTVRLQDVRFYPEAVPETALLRDGDLLFTRYNGNPDFTAVCGMVKGLTCHTAYPDKLIRVRLSEAADPKFVEVMAAATQSRNWLTPHIKTAAGQHGISGADLKLLPIPLPSIRQQQTIARRIDIAFAWIDRLACETTNARKLVDHLDQAILAKAFRGELVPQDLNDEPASVLLERIRTEREATAHPGSRKRRVKLSSPSAARSRRPK